MDDLTTNFCGLERKSPRKVTRLRSISQASNIIGTCRAAKESVNLRGAGHGSGDRNIGSGHLMLNSLPSRMTRLDDSCYCVSSSMRWIELERALNNDGRAAPVLTNWPDVTIGGTLAAGGFGSASLNFGSQVDWVERIHVVLPNGSAVWIGKDDARFPLMLSAQGIHGFVAEAEIATRACPTSWHWSRYGFDSLECWCDAITEVISQKPSDTTHLVAQGRWEGFEITMATGEGHDLALQGIPPCQWELDHESWREGLLQRQFEQEVVNPWADYVLPASYLGHFLSRLFSDLAEEKMQQGAFPRFRILFVDPCRAPPATASFAPHKGAYSLLAGVGVYFVLPRTGVEEIAAARRVLARSLALCGDLNGRPYLPGWHEMEEAEMQRFYPNAISKSRELKRRNDPDDLFNPGMRPAF
ncbi:FAD-binding oxidoreductase [Roseibium sp. AS2]|uniref:FAD-binding oxidoreductase n=1 Tax=Roseibium sp. AS2 TaxID=3135781 RepID=UPI003172E9AD